MQELKCCDEDVTYIDAFWHTRCLLCSTIDRDLTLTGGLGRPLGKVPLLPRPPARVIATTTAGGGGRLSERDFTAE